MKKNWITHFTAGFLGVMVGAGTVFYIAPKEQIHKTEEATKTNQLNTQPVSTKIKEIPVSSFTKMIQEEKKHVVGVMNYKKSTFLREKEEKAGSGSGVIYKKKGNKAYIVTNYHVVEGADSLEIKLENGDKKKGKLLGVDPWLDLAVIEAEGTDIPDVAKLGDSSSVQVGETAIAIGNPLGFLEGTVTKGIISSKERVIPVDINGDGKQDFETQVIQTDASINPGNSGGALFNEKGEVIGINSSKIAEQSVEGIGFSIPVNVAKPILESIEKHGKVNRPKLGVSYISLDEIASRQAEEILKLPKKVTKGIIVTEVEKDSPADRSNIKKYDVIIALDGEKIQNELDLRRVLFEKKKIGEKVSVIYYREGKEKTTTIQL